MDELAERKGDRFNQSPEIELAKLKILEKAVLVHGFKGNIEKPETETVRDLLLHGHITSPSKRNLDNKEIKKYEEKIPVDLNRIHFHCSYKDQTKDSSYQYRGNSLFVMPVKAAEGNVIAQNTLLGHTDIYLYSKEGVEIPLNKGVLVMTKDLFGEVQDVIPETAKKLRLPVDEFIANNIMIVDEDTIGDPNKFWGAINEKVAPSSGVTYKAPSYFTLNNHANDLPKLLDQIEPAKAEELGD